MPDNSVPLIQRLCEAEGASRELDAEIARYLGEGTSLSVEINPQPCGTEGNYIPSYTSSTDAALTLVREGCGFKISFEPTEESNVHWASVNFGNRSYGATAALALCIAALSSRTTKEG